jgi:hypothetical protein
LPLPQDDSPKATGQTPQEESANLCEPDVSRQVAMHQNANNWVTKKPIPPPNPSFLVRERRIRSHFFILFSLAVRQPRGRHIHPLQQGSTFEKIQSNAMPASVSV